MGQSLKSRRELELMRAAGRVVFKALMRAKEHARAGMSTAELDQIVFETYTSAGGHGLFRWYPSYTPGKGFPGNTCISVNDEVVHGIPGDRKLVDGDIVSVDCGIRLGGYCGDAATTILIGTVPEQARKLCQVTQETLEMAVREIRPGRKWSDVARLMQKHVEKNGFACVENFVGHGIGKDMHEAPKVPNFVPVGGAARKDDFYLQPGMTLAVEPMVIAGDKETVLLTDGWTVVTKDHSPAAHYEHTIAVTATGSDVLTDGR